MINNYYAKLDTIHLTKPGLFYIIIGSKEMMNT